MSSVLGIATEGDRGTLGALIALKAADLFPAARARYETSTQGNGFICGLIRKTKVGFYAPGH